MWNALGIIDFVIAMATGFLTSPGPLHLLAVEHPNLIGSAYPLVMLPAFLVPFSSILHGLCLWKLRRQRQAYAVLGAASATRARGSSLQDLAHMR
jgi:hypothetical protein